MIWSTESFSSAWCLIWKVLKKKLLTSSYCWHHLCIHEHSKRCYQLLRVVGLLLVLMYVFLNCLSSLKTCSGYANKKRNTILKYWRWIHFVIWPSVYALPISQYSFVSLPNETAREKRRWGWVIGFILKKRCRNLLCIALIKSLNTTLIF